MFGLALVARDGIRYHPKFSRVFSGDYSPPALVPIENQLFNSIALDNVIVNDNLTAIGN